MSSLLAQLLNFSVGLGCQQLLGVSQLRYPLRMDQAGHLDQPVAGCHQSVDELELQLRHPRHLAHAEVRIGGKAPGQIKRLLPKNRPVLITVYDTD